MKILDANAISKAAAIISQGGIIAFRTDTFYGLGVDPFRRAAVQRLKLIKGRDDGKPILLLISDVDQVARLLRQPSETFRLIAENFWPGPLTIVGEAVSTLPDDVTAGTKTVGLRLPGDEKLRWFLEKCGGALTATSANRSGKPPARSAAEVTAEFEEGIDAVIDGGLVTSTEPSTVIDATQTPPVLIREGVIKRDQLEKVVRLKAQS